MGTALTRVFLTNPRVKSPLPQTKNVRNVTTTLTTPETPKAQSNIPISID